MLEKDLTWPQARYLARRGWHVRRWGWADRWIIYHLSWWWSLYRDGTRHPVRAGEFTLDDWLAGDFTSIPSELLTCPAVIAADENAAADRGDELGDPDVDGGEVPPPSPGDDEEEKDDPGVSSGGTPLPPPTLPPAPPFPYPPPPGGGGGGGGTPPGGGGRDRPETDAGYVSPEVEFSVNQFCSGADRIVIPEVTLGNMEPGDKFFVQLWLRSESANAGIIFAPGGTANESFTVDDSNLGAYLGARAVLNNVGRANGVQIIRDESVLITFDHQYGAPPESGPGTAYPFSISYAEAIDWFRKAWAFSFVWTANYQSGSPPQTWNQYDMTQTGTLNWSPYSGICGSRATITSQDVDLGFEKIDGSSGPGGTTLVETRLEVFFSPSTSYLDGDSFWPNIIVRMKAVFPNFDVRGKASSQSTAYENASFLPDPDETTEIGSLNWMGNTVPLYGLDYDARYTPGGSASLTITAT